MSRRALFSPLVVERSKSVRTSVTAVVMLSLSSLLFACSVNPATGRRQVNMISEQQEIAMGQQNHEQIMQQFGVLDDPELQTYIQDLGSKMAAASERPQLPWTFTVLDDPLVNAFALPGGYIYVTRGILSHLNSEAELAGVVGHEIGHVTARHSVNQMSKGMLAQIGLMAGMMASPDNAQAINDLGGTGLSLLFLKYGRDDERQSDSLGLRYAVKTGFDPHSIPGVFQMLGRVSQAAGASPTPNWLATHPAPVDRTARLEEQIRPLEPIDGTVNRDSYLARLDGMVFGADPREGFFKDNVFYHPGMAFQFQVPPGWMTQNTRQAVLAASQQQDAVMVLRLAPGASAREAAAKFFSQQGVRQGDSWRDNINGLSAVSRAFEVPREQGDDIQGVVAFIEHGQQVFQLMSYTVKSRFGQLGNSMLEALGSFERVTDRRILEVEPRRVATFVMPETGPLSSVRQLQGEDIAELELINNLDPGQSVDKGTKIKILDGRLP